MYKGGRFWVRLWTFGFHKMRGIPWLAAKPVSFSRRTLLHGVSNMYKEKIKSNYTGILFCFGLEMIFGQSNFIFSLQTY